MKSNLHTLVHLADSLRDTGPEVGLWCFLIERFNGMMDGKAQSKVRI